MADVRLLLKQATAARGQQANNNATGRKRKAAAAALSTPTREEKKSKLVGPSTTETVVDEEPSEAPPVASSSGHVDASDNRAEDNPDTHAAELAALDRELAAMAAEHVNHVAPAISAPPLSAAEIAAQARAEQSAQRSSRDAELELEREDAVKALEDEFDVLEGFEERAKRLRSRREALRTSRLQQQSGSTADSLGATALPHIDSEPPSTVTGHAQDGGSGDDDGDDDDDDDDDGDDLAGWHFGSSR